MKTEKRTDQGKKVLSITRHIAIIIYLLCLCSLEASAAIDLDAGVKSIIDPVKKMINDYYAVAIFISGAFGALLQPQGDLRDRMMGFGKGALVGGLVVTGVKTGLGV